MVSDWSCYLLESSVCPAKGRLYIEEPVPIIERVDAKLEFTPAEGCCTERTPREGVQEDYDGDFLLASQRGGPPLL